MRSASLTVPAQSILLFEVEEQDGRWSGDISINGQDFRVEAYAVNTTNDVVEECLSSVSLLAECGDVLNPILIDGRPSLLVVLPKGL